MTKFQNYIKNIGVENSATILNITERTALAYLRSERSPRMHNIPDLIKKSRGKLNYASFFESDESLNLAIFADE